MRPPRLQFPIIWFAAAVTAAFPGCAKKDEPEASPRTANSVVVLPPQLEVPTIVWRDPPNWQREEGSSSMRKASYKIAAVSGDSEGAEAAVYYFGRTSGGSIEANIQRWIGQFPEVPPAEVKRVERTANGMRQTVVDIHGTYDGSSMTIREVGKKPQFRMIAAVVETPAGNYFFKLTGPQKTVESARSAYFALLDSVNKG